MENHISVTPKVCYYNPNSKMKTVLTSTGEKTLKEAEDELMPILKKHYINQMLRKDSHG